MGPYYGEILAYAFASGSGPDASNVVRRFESVGDRIMCMDTKPCTTCNKTLPLADFALKNKERGTRSSYCKVCQNAKSKAHYERNKQPYLKRAAVRNEALRRENVTHLMTYLQDHPCLDCGETDPVVLEFDHRDPSCKSYNISERLGRTKWSTLLVEIAKCDVVCSNCHRRRTAVQFGWLKANG